MRCSQLLPLLALGSVAQAQTSPDEVDSRLSRHEISNVQELIDNRTFGEEVAGYFKSKATCFGCQAIQTALKGLAHLGDRVFVKSLQGICLLAPIDNEVCKGAVELEGPIIAATLRSSWPGSRSNNLFCKAVLGVCEYPAIRSSPLSLSDKPEGRRPAPSGKKPLKIVHFSDIHIDPQYVEGSNTDCGKPICCRPYTEDDEPGNTDSPAGKYGDHACDTPFTLESSMYKAIGEVAPDAAFALFTGDIVDHTIWDTSQAYSEKMIKHAYKQMDSTLDVVYGTAGNHEAHPANAFKPSNLGKATQWVYDALLAQWQQWVGSEEQSDILKRGAYSTKHPGSNLRVISLNTNFYYRHNFWVYHADVQRDPNGQLQWLVDELAAAEEAGESVYILGHMPMGNADALREGSEYFNEITERYSNTIAAMFFGHTHVDHFEISYDDYASRGFGNAHTMSYIMPSLTPTSGMPAFRVYEVDPETYGVLDVVTYSADMSAPDYQTKGPTWKRYYSAREAYGQLVTPPLAGDSRAELTPAFWHNVTSAMEADQTTFDEYVARKSRGWKAGEEPCQGKCREDEICDLRAGHSQFNCYTQRPFGFDFRRREVDEHGEHDECGPSVTEHMLMAMAGDKDLLTILQDAYIENGANITAEDKQYY